MKDQSKTKQQLIQELAFLKQRITELEKTEAGRKRLEEELVESEHLYRTLVETSPDAILMYTLDGTILAVNSRLVEKYGATSVADFHSRVKTVFDLIDDYDQASETANFRRAVVRGGSQRNEYRVRLLNGNYITVEINSSVVKAADGKPQAFISIARDITERKLVEEALRDREEKYRTLFENANEAIFVAQDGKLVFSNPKTTTISGYSDVELMSKPFIDFIHPDDREMVIDRHIRRMKGEDIPQLYDFRIIHKDGDIRWFELNAVQMNWNGKKATLNFASDITDNKRIEETLRQEEERFRSLIQSLSDMLFIIDRRGQLTYESPSVSRILGYEPGYFIGKSPFIHIHPDDLDQVAKDLDEVFRAVNPGKPTVFRYRKADGAWVDLEALGSNHYDNPRIGGLVITARNITESKRIETALQKAEAEKAVILESVSDMIFHIDRDMHVLYSNAAIDRFFHLAGGGLQGERCFKALHRLDGPCRSCPAIEAMESGGHRQAYVSSYGRHWRLDAFPVRDESGAVTGAIEVATDITELRNAEEKYRAIFDNATNGIYQSTPDGRLISVNPALASIFGYNSPESMMRDVTNVGQSLYADPGKRKQFLHLIEEQGIVKNFEFEGLKKNGEHIYVSDNGRPVRDTKGNTLYYEGIVQDITERKQAEEALRTSEVRYKSIFENTGTVMLIVEEDMTISYANSQFENLTGYPRTEIEGKKKWTEFVHKDDLERMVQQHKLRRTDKDRSIRSYEFRLVHRDGHVRNILLIVDIIPETKRSVVSLIDITERRRAEEALRESEELYKKLFDHHAAVKLLIDPDTGRILDANESAFHYYGWSHDRLKQMKIQDINTLPPQDIRREMERARNDKRVYFEFRHRRADGSIRDVEVFSSGIEVKGKQLLHSIVHDITDRKQVEGALRESEERFRALSENAPDIIYTMDLQGAITYVNPSWKRILGHDQKDLLGHYFIDFAREEDRKSYRKLFKGIRDNKNTVRNYIGIMPTKDGAERVFNMNSTFNRDSKGGIIGVVGTMKDITEQREMEQKLGHVQRMESIGTLAGGIAHDFNNLLMGIQGYASLMLLDLDASHPHYDRLKRIEEQVQSGADLTKQLLGFARGGRYETRPTDMNDIIYSTSSMFGRTKKEIVIHRSLDSDLWTVDIDRGQIEQVFMNMYVNAWQAMPGGGELYLETVNVLIEEDSMLSHTITPGRYIKASITDTGIGMDAKTRERIFDPFFTTKAMGRGTGLGLAMVYGIIKGHRGMIDVTSEIGRGTTFEIYLPATERALVKEQTAAIQILIGTETVLLVDDEQMVLEVTRELLESLGYRVYAAGSGQEGIAVYMEKRNEIDLVILDMVMPGLSGGETFDRLREIDPQIRVLLSSGYSITGQAKQILERGCNGFLQKPFQLKTLSQKIREVLSGLMT